MFAILITWVALGNMRLVTISEPLPLVACQAARAEAVTTDTVMAAACITNGAMVHEALTTGACRPTDVPATFVCNGRLPKWN